MTGCRESVKEMARVMFSMIVQFGDEISHPEWRECPGWKVSLNSLPLAFCLLVWRRGNITRQNI